VPLEAAVTTTCDALAAKADQRGVAVAVAIDASLRVHADPTALGQILQNLLDNAIKYAAEGGHVRVRAATAEGNAVRIEVEDDGPGVEPKHRERVFERFYRVDPGRSRELGGTGLGLSIVKHLAETMGGRVGMRPAERRGSVFWFELPRP
jgi:two-component system phosphate regulon sensor histidine kinase PhoR